MKKIIVIITLLLVSGCSHSPPEWMVIDEAPGMLIDDKFYPIPSQFLKKPGIWVSRPAPSV